MKFTKEEEQYLHWKRNYYDGNTLVPDSEFDELEEKLKSLGSTVINMVGSKIAGETISHPTPMKSLQKINVLPESDTYEKEAIRKWINKYFQATPGVTIDLECTLKYDGNAFNAIYEKGKLKKILTRGDGTKGQDVTHKLGLISFEQCSPDEDFEIRGEVLIRKDIYEKKYMDPQNPKNARNFVAGILNNRNVVDIDVVNDLVMMYYDIKINGKYNSNYGIDHLNDVYNLAGNKAEVFYLKSDLSNYEEIYEKFVTLRKDSSFLIDGFVIKFPEALRSQIPEKDHHPEWAMAIKFPPTEKSTTIIDIEWQLGKTGELTPVAILTPVDIDGSTVSKASMYNYGWVKDMKAFPGAKVSISKAGEIIPKINEILEEASEYYPFPNMYFTSSENYILEVVDNIHLCIISDGIVDEIEVRKLRNGLEILGFKGIGPSAAEDLYYAGITDISKFWTPLFTKEKLIESGQFKEGRALDIIFDVMGSITEFEIKDVIHALQYEDAGKSVSRELGKYVSGVDYDFKSLTKKPLDEFMDINSVFSKMYYHFIEILNKANMTIKCEEKAKGENHLIFEMTGSPKPHFDVKADVVDFAKRKSFTHGKLDKNCYVLLTDDLESNSSKMVKAKKLGVNIMTYEEFKTGNF